jgi:hypothetical protein
MRPEGKATGSTHLELVASEVASLDPHPPSKLEPNLARIPQPDTQIPW